MAGKVRTGTLYDGGESVLAGELDTWVVRTGPRQGTPVVFLHGNPTSAYAYREVLRALSEERDCVAFDWPGFGQSEKPWVLDHSLRARASHLHALLDALALPQVDLVAHDVGGPAALLFAAEHPARVRRIVLLNTTVYKSDLRPPVPALTQFVPVVRNLARPMFKRPAFEFFFRSGLARPERLQRDVVKHHWLLASRDHGLRHVFNVWAQLPQDQPALEELRAKLPSLHHPLLVLFGADDPYLPPPNAERLAKEIPHAQLRLVPNAGHFVMEDAPEVVVERVSDFLA